MRTKEKSYHGRIEWWRKGFYISGSIGSIKWRQGIRSTTKALKMIALGTLYIDVLSINDFDAPT